MQPTRGGTGGRSLWPAVQLWGRGPCWLAACESVRINMPNGVNRFQFCKKRSQLVNAVGEFCKWLICNAGLPPYKA